MPVYTVHEPPVTSATRDDAMRVAFVRDGFHFWAFLLGPVWMIWRGLWLVTILYAVFWLVLGTAFYLAKVSGTAGTAISFLIALLVGFEAPTLRRWTLRRRGFREVAAVVGDDLESAERRFFSARTEKSAMPARAAQPAGVPRNAAPDVVGLFPEPGGPR